MMSSSFIRCSIFMLLFLAMALVGTWVSMILFCVSNEETQIAATIVYAVAMFLLCTALQTVMDQVVLFGDLYLLKARGNQTITYAICMMILVGMTVLMIHAEVTDATDYTLEKTIWLDGQSLTFLVMLFPTLPFIMYSAYMYVCVYVYMRRNDQPLVEGYHPQYGRFDDKKPTDIELGIVQNA